MCPKSFDDEQCDPRIIVGWIYVTCTDYLKHGSLYILGISRLALLFGWGFGKRVLSMQDQILKDYQDKNNKKQNKESKSDTGSPVFWRESIMDYCTASIINSVILFCSGVTEL